MLIAGRQAANGRKCNCVRNCPTVLPIQPTSSGDLIATQLSRQIGQIIGARKILVRVIKDGVVFLFVILRRFGLVAQARVVDFVRLSYLLLIFSRESRLFKGVASTPIQVVLLVISAEQRQGRLAVPFEVGAFLRSSVYARMAGEKTSHGAGAATSH